MTRFLGLVWLLGVCSGSAAAQTPDTLPSPRPFVRGGVYDRPYLTRLMGRTAVGGYAEAHARWMRAEGATVERGFEAKRWNLFTATDVSDIVRIGAELEVEEGGEEIKLEYAAIDLRVTPAFALRAGMLLSPLGRFNLAHDSPLNEFTDRPLVSTDLLGTALSEPGIGVFGAMALGRGRFTYEVYAVNGFHDGLITASPEGTRIPLGRANVEDDNHAPAVVGRVTWSPVAAFEVGVSAHHGAYNRFEEEGITLDERRDLTLAAVDLDASGAGFRVAGEAGLVRIDVPAGLVGVYAERQRGVYLEVLRDLAAGVLPTMPQSHLTVGVRLDIVDFDADLRGDSRRQVTAGLNFRPTADTVAKLNYVRGTERDRFNNPADFAGVLFSIATYF